MLSELVLSAVILLGGYQGISKKCEKECIKSCVCKNFKCDKETFSVSLKNLELIKILPNGEIRLKIKSGRQVVKNWREENGPLKKERDCEKPCVNGKCKK